MKTIYEKEWERQRARTDVAPKHLAVHRWHLRFDQPWTVEPKPAPRDSLEFVRAEKPSIHFYRYLYHTAGEDFVWGDRRRMSDEDLLPQVQHEDVHLMVMYDNGTPTGFFEMSFRKADTTKLEYFALLPGNLGGGLGSYMLNQAICFSGQRQVPLILNTCTLDHPIALQNYLKRGFVIFDEEDIQDLDPRLDGTMPRTAGAHVPLAS